MIKSIYLTLQHVDRLPGNFCLDCVIKSLQEAPLSLEELDKVRSVHGLVRVLGTSVGITQIMRVVRAWTLSSKGG